MYSEQEKEWEEQNITVGELIEFLKDIPNDYKVYHTQESFYEYVIKENIEVSHEYKLIEL